jgi:predicted RNA-binding protein
MCEANIYIIRDEKEELVMEAVDQLETEADGTYRIVSIFGEQKTIKGHLKGMHLVDHRIVFEA